MAAMAGSKDNKGNSPTLEPESTGDVVDVNETYSPEEERAVLRKIDLTILPMV